MMLRRLPHVVWLMVVWIALWGDISVANIVSGTIVAGLITWIFADLGPRPVTTFRPLGALKLVWWFITALVKSTLEVARLVLRSEPVKPAIITYPMRDVSDAVVTLVANAITATPGTLTLDVRADGDDAVLFVHVLDLDDEEGARADLDELVRLVLLAFGDREALEHLEEATA